jgi:hypothetical protein
LRFTEGARSSRQKSSSSRDVTRFGRNVRRRSEEKTATGKEKEKNKGRERQQAQQEDPD